MKIGFVNPVCSYCHSKMTLTITSIKRSVPAGAQDLGLSDEMMCWKCQKCGQKSREGIGACGCGKEALELGQPELSTLKNVPVKLLGSAHRDYEVHANYKTSAGCTSCVKCGICQQNLASYDFEVALREDKTDWHNTTYYSYTHSECVANQRSQWEAERREREKREQEKQARIGQGLCYACGEALSFLDRLGSRQTHKQCA